jgi:hypothetical protein
MNTPSTIPQAEVPSLRKLLTATGVALLAAIVLLVVAPTRARRILQRVRDWLIQNGRTIAVVIILFLAAALLRNGISGLVN